MTRRVILVGPLPPPAGGMANQTEQLARLLRGEAMDVVIVRTNEPYRPAWVARIKVLRAVWRLASYVRALSAAIRAGDVVHVMANSGWSWHLFAAPAIWVSRARGARVLVNYRGGEAEHFLGRSSRLVRLSMRRAQFLAVPSRFLQTVFAKFGMNASIVPNVVDLTRFRPPVARDAGGAPHLVVTRNLEAIYDVGTSVRAFARIRSRFPDARLTVAGTGPERDTLSNLCRTLHVEDAVTFTGRLTPDDMSALLRSADVMLNSSIADNTPNAILEALASAVPVVSTDAGGIPYLVEHGVNAMLVPVRSDEALANAAIEILMDPGLRATLISNGLREASRFTWENVRESLLSAYDACSVHGSPSVCWPVTRSDRS